MSTARLALRSTRTLRLLSRSSRTFTIYNPRRNEFEALNKRANDTAEEYRRRQMQKDLNPHMTNTASTIASQMPSVGKDAAPPEMLSAVEGKFEPKDAVPENTKKMTGGAQDGKGKVPESMKKRRKGEKQGGEANVQAERESIAATHKGVNGELGVGELEGAKFKIEPLRRTGEDANTMRARLLCTSTTPPPPIHNKSSCI